MDKSTKQGVRWLKTLLQSGGDPYYFMNWLVEIFVWVFKQKSNLESKPEATDKQSTAFTSHCIQYEQSKRREGGYSLVWK